MNTPNKQRALVICPGRGTYNRTELGYLKKYHADKIEFITAIDRYREQQQQPPVSELDRAEAFRASQHTRGDNASALIYACALADFQSIDPERFEIAAVTGNSMGWYLALACADALSPEAAIQLVNHMGTLMHQAAAGGQVVYPLVNEQWQPDPQLQADYEEAVARVAAEPGAEVYSSIRLGGMAILAANDPALKLLLKTLPPVQERYPFALPNHGAFHSPLMAQIAEQAQRELPESLFSRPAIPLIDGRGHIWQPYATDLSALHRYTLGHQIDHCYDYSAAIEVGIKEFAPDKLIILGPGATLGAPTAQVLLQQGWLGMHSKQDFKQQQSSEPFILSMGKEEQRGLLV